MELLAESLPVGGLCVAECRRLKAGERRMAGGNIVWVTTFSSAWLPMWHDAHISARRAGLHRSIMTKRSSFVFRERPRHPIWSVR